MLAARAEGVGSTLTGMLQSFYSDEVFDLLGVPKDAGWVHHGVIAMGYPTGKWGVAPRQTRPRVRGTQRLGLAIFGFTVPEPLWP